MHALALGWMNAPLADELDPLAALAIAARDGDGRAFGQLYDQTREVAWAALFRVVGPSPDLEDLLQDSYVQLLKALRGFRFDSKVTTFLHRVCVNVGLMHLRSKRRRPEDPHASPAEHFVAGPAADPHRTLELTQAKGLMQKALATMSDEKARVLALHDLLDLKPEEISRLEDVPANTVRSRLNRAREALVEALASLGAPR